MIKHIAFTFYPVTDVARARRFYEDALGLALTKNFKDAWIEYHLENGAFAISNMAKGVKPAANAGGSVSFEVDDIAATVAGLRAKGVTIKTDVFDTPVCRMAYVLDPDGNAVGLHQKKA